MSNESSPRSVNFNSVLLTLVLGLSSWTLVTLNTTNKDTATQQVKLDTGARDLADLRVRMSAVELQVQQTRIQLATLEATIRRNP